MAFLKFLKFLKFKLIKRKKVSDKVAAINLDEEDNPIRVFNFSWEQIQKFTMNFSRIIGYGGFSTVYLAQLPDSTKAAVKIQCTSGRLSQIYQQELEILLHLHHPNIIKLLAHCHDREEGILVTDYIPNGNLHEKLHGSGNSPATVIPWNRRLAIAFQLAEAIEYLHDKCNPRIVHGDVKSSNVLLDKDLNCKLCDFGSAKMGFSSTVVNSRSNNRTVMVGSPGYTDPYYLRTGFASTKNDIYGFGVILLELVTGLEAVNCNGVRLTVTALPLLRDVEKVGKMIDPRLGGEIELEEAKAMVGLAATCLAELPTLRPRATDIVTEMRRRILSLSVLDKY